MLKKTSNAGKNLIKQFEGFRAIAYLCPANVWTIGYGTTRINGKAVKGGMKITTTEAEQFLEEDLKQYETCVNQNVLVQLSQNQFDALVCLVYNIGVGNFSRSTLLKVLNTGNYALAAQEFSKWNKAGGKVVSGLTRRRAAEKELFIKG